MEAAVSTKPCPSFPGYSASDDGRIFTHRRRTRTAGMGSGGTVVVIDPNYVREMKQCTIEKGYLACSVRRGGKARGYGVHILVADAFHGPKPSPEHQVRHLDGNPTNNAPSNLAWGTTRENANDRMRHGHYARGDQHQNARLTEDKVRQIFEARANGVKVFKIARDLSVSRSCVEDVLYGKTWTHVGIQFRRVEFERVTP